MKPGPELLGRVGVTLYGPRWQSDLARLVEVNDRSVRAWAYGERDVPAEVWPLLAAALAARARECRDLAKQLPKR